MTLPQERGEVTAAQIPAFFILRNYESNPQYVRRSDLFGIF